jgi:hypothetical protein
LKSTTLICIPALQLVQARSELDALEEILVNPVMTQNMAPWKPFFAAVPQLLSSETSVGDFQKQLVATLFPRSPYLNMAEHIKPCLNSA